MIHGASYLKRSLEFAIDAAGKTFPALLVTGPRQSGKSTLLRHRFGQSHDYVSLDRPDLRAIAVADPQGWTNTKTA